MQFVLLPSPTERANGSSALHPWKSQMDEYQHPYSSSKLKISYLCVEVHSCLPQQAEKRCAILLLQIIRQKKKKKMHRLTVKERPIFLTLLLHLFSPSVWLWMLFFSLGFFKNPPPQKLSVLWLVILPQSVVIGLSLSVCNVMKCNSPYHNRPAPEGIL